MKDGGGGEWSLFRHFNKWILGLYGLKYMLGSLKNGINGGTHNKQQVPELLN